jgi:hypothetical protein
MKIPELGQVKRRSLGGFNLSFLPWTPRNGRLHNGSYHTLLSRRLRYCCVGFAPSRNAWWVTPIEMHQFGYLILVIIDMWTDQVLTEHNRARARYGARPLKWSAPLHAAVVQYAQMCKFAHRCGGIAFFLLKYCWAESLQFSQVMRRVNTGKIWYVISLFEN